MAMHNLFGSNMLFGIAENFDGYLRLLKSRGVISDVTPLYANSSPAGEAKLEDAVSTFTPNQTDILERFTYWDSLLYDAAAAVARLQ